MIFDEYVLEAKKMTNANVQLGTKGADASVEHTEGQPTVNYTLSNSTIPDSNSTNTATADACIQDFCTVVL